MKEYYVSIDVGGTALKYGIIDEHAQIIKKDSVQTNTAGKGEGILEQIVKITEKEQENFKISGICVSTAGIVDCEKGKILYAGELIPGYTGTEIKKQMEERFQIPCAVENDVNCAGLAEVVSGAAVGRKSVVCLTVGTGIGGCVILAGEVYHGYGNCAGEVGYLYMDGSDFQTLGAGSIMSKKIAGKKNGRPEEWNGIKIFEYAKQGDEDCIRAIEEMTEVLGKGIASICYVLNPQMVVLGGGVMEQKEVLKPLIEKQIQKYLKPILLEKTEIAFAKHGNNAGILGAFYNFKKYYRKEKNKEARAFET